MLKDNALECLPEKLKPIDVQDSLGRLTNVVQGALYRFVDTPIQSVVVAAQKMARSLSENKPPKIGDANDPFLLECRERCKLFASWEYEDNADTEPHSLKGKEAVIKMIETCEAKITKCDSLSYP